jgi:hypothetical protein
METTNTAPADMTLAEAIRLGVDALRGDAAAAADGIDADPAAAARDRSAAMILEHVAIDAAARAPLPSDRKLADLIEGAINAAGGGEDGWSRLELEGTDEYLALATLAEIARVVVRMIRNGNASAAVLRDCREAMMIDD